MSRHCNDPSAVRSIAIHRRRWPGRVATLTVAASLLAARAASGEDATVPVADTTRREVVVTAGRLRVETRLDSKVYNLADDAQADFGSLADILGNIPSVEVDGEGSVSLRGDSHVLILINGRPSAELSGPAAGDALQQIPANDIDRIEVYTTPPPQFKVEGTAGVINIVLKRKTGAGTSGGLQAGAGSGGRSTYGGQLAGKSGPWTLSVHATLRSDLRRRLVNSTLVAPTVSGGSELTSVNAIDETIHRHVPVFKASIGFDPTEADSVSASAARTVRSGNRYYTQLGSSADADGATVASYRRQSAGHDWSMSSEQELSYGHRFATAGEELTLTVSRSFFYQREDYAYLVTAYVPAAVESRSRFRLDEDSLNNGASVDYVLPLTKTRIFKAGYDAGEENYRSGASTAPEKDGTGTFVTDPNLSNEFQVVRQIHAAYVSLRDSAGPWSGLGGLRLEDETLRLRQLTDNEQSRHRARRIYPSLRVERTLSETATLSFGASRRIARPDPDSLNPYIDREYTPNLRAGNPDLRPQDTRGVELTFARETPVDAYSLTAYARRNADTVTDVTRYLGGGFSLTTKANLPKNDAFGLEAALSGRLAAALSYNLSANAFHSEIDASSLGYPGLRSTAGINLKAQFDFHPRPADSAQLTFTRSDKRLTPQGFVDAIDVVNLGYRRVLNRELTLVATASDVFNGQRYRRYASTPTLQQTYQRQIVGRIFYVGLTWTFGAQKKNKSPSFDYD